MVEPLTAGFVNNQLTVLAVDRAGNRSVLPTGATYSYAFKAHAAAGWWRTNGSGTTIPNIAQNTKPLTLNGSASLGSGVLTLNGPPANATTATPVVNTTGSFTVAAWVRPTT